MTFDATDTDYRRKLTEEIEGAGGLLRQAEVARRLGVSRGRIGQLWQEGKMPTPDQMNDLGTPSWFGATIDQWRSR